MLIVVLLPLLEKREEEEEEEEEDVIQEDKCAGGFIKSCGNSVREPKKLEPTSQVGGTHDF